MDREVNATDCGPQQPCSVRNRFSEEFVRNQDDENRYWDVVRKTPEPGAPDQLVYSALYNAIWHEHPTTYSEAQLSRAELDRYRKLSEERGLSAQAKSLELVENNFSVFAGLKDGEPGTAGQGITTRDIDQIPNYYQLSKLGHWPSTADSDPRIDPKLHPRLDFTVKAVAGLSGAVAGGAIELAVEVPNGGAGALGFMSIGVITGVALAGGAVHSPHSWMAPVAAAAAGFFYGPSTGATLGYMAAEPIERQIWNLRFGSQYMNVFHKLDSIAL
jgi:hypothetical protein